MAVEVRIKMTPKQAGALYMKHEALKEKLETVKRVCTGKEQIDVIDDTAALEWLRNFLG